MKQGLPETFSSLRNRLLNDSLLWVAFAALPALAISLARVTVIGWQPVMWVHIVIVASLWLIWLGRERITYHVRVFAILAAVWLVTFAGLVQFGPMAMSGIYVAIFAFIAVLFLGGRVGAWLIAASTVCLTVVGWAAVEHWIEFKVDYPIYAHHPLAWLNMIWALSAFPAILAVIGWRMMTGLIERESFVRALAERQQKIATNLPGVIYQFLLRRDGSACFPYMSESNQRSFGVSQETLKEDASTAFALIHPQDINRVRETIEHSARDLVPVHESFRIIHPEQGVLWIERSSTPERLDNGDTLWHGFMRDITDLRLAEQRLSATLENSPNVAVQWFDRDGRVRYWNHASELIFGWTAAEAIDKTLEQLFFTPAQASLFKDRLAHIEATGDTVGPAEYHPHHRDGSPRVVSSTVFTILGDAEPLFVCMDVDITERKRAEDALQRYQFIANTVQDMMTLISHEHRYEAVNDRWCERMGKIRTEVIGKHLAEVWGEAVYQQTIAPMLDHCIAEAAPVFHRATINLSEGARDCEITYHPYNDATGRVSHVVVVTRDITAQLQAERQLIEAKELSDQANQAKSAFLASMSHELRTPLNAIIGFAQLLEMGKPVPLRPEQEEAVGHILNGGRHLLGLINEVLDLARIEAGKLDISSEILALDMVVAEAIALTGPSAIRRNISLRSTCMAGMFVVADAARLRQILLNLLSNAVKYNREGGMVTVSCQRKADMCRITIVDTGQGIPQEMHAQVFEPFHRLGAEHTTVEGTGIGLVICKRIAEVMGGRIGFESEVGVGSRFWLDLPASAAECGNTGDNGEHEPIHEKVARVQGRVLYVEDNIFNLSVMEHIFRHVDGVELLLAESAEEGLAMARNNPPDLVLMDINLPGMSGLEALQVLKSDPRTVFIPVVAVSASAMSRDIQAGLDAGFQDYLTKPFDVPKLIALVRKTLTKAAPPGASP